MATSLFPENRNKVEKISIQDGELRLYPHFFSPEERETFFTQLKKNVTWQQEEIKLYGKRIPLPRLTAWFGDEGKTYMYSGITVEPEPWTPTLLEIKNRIEEVSNVTFNSVLLNYYYTLNQLTALKPINSTEHSINEQNQFVEAEEDPTYEEATISTPSLELSSLQKNAEVSSTLKVGQTLTAKVERINTTAVFVALGEVKGFIPPSELTLKRANHPSDVVSVDEEVEVIVTDLKAENDGKLPVLRLRSKHNEWIHRVGEKEYRKDSEVEVTITRIHPDHGAFVELEEGISGLIYQSTIPPDIFDQLQEGQKIPAIISHVDLENEKISLRLYDRWNSSGKLDKISSPSHTQTVVGYGT